MENILVDAEGHVLLTDFGLSIDLNDGIPESGGKMAGTLEYVSPECLDEDLPYGLSSDWWSVGILAHELLTGQSPFATADSERDMMRNKILKEQPVLDDELEDAPLDFIVRLLHKNATFRLGFKNGAQELKDHVWFKEIDWNLLTHKIYPVPIPLNFVDKYDVGHFDNIFTSSSVMSFDNSTDEQQIIEGILKRK